MNNDNKIKNLSGKNAYLLISEMVNSLRDELNLEFILKEHYKIGYPNKEKQFKMDYELSFPKKDEKKWLIKSTNSVRDRIYGTEFFSQHIRELDENVSKIYVVVPDSLTYKELLMSTDK